MLDIRAEHGIPFGRSIMVADFEIALLDITVPPVVPPSTSASHAFPTQDPDPKKGSLLFVYARKEQGIWFRMQILVACLI